MQKGQSFEMDVNFLFMDDSFHPATRISSLTGVLVPVDRYPDLRDDFYKLLAPLIQPSKGIIRRAPELHGYEFLPQESDETKLRILEGIASLVHSHHLRIYRVGYFITPTIEKCFSSDNRLLGLCFRSLLSMMQPVLANERLIPIMDGLDRKTVGHFSPSLKSLDEMRAVGLEPSLSLKFSQNLLGEVFYADSAHSALIQVADTIAYLRNASNLAAFGIAISPFKSALQSISAKLKQAIVWEEHVSLVLDGRPQGPEAYVQKPHTGHGPLRAAYKITPSDTEDIATQINKIDAAVAAEKR
jgi:hypothetical protein